MNAGVIVLGQHSDSAGERAVAERCAGFLRDNGRRNVNIAFHYGTPSSDIVMESMNLDGVDTFVILPLAISEGRMTVWNMPGRLGLPDNCGSWRMMNGKDVATRFATALGKNDALADDLIEREGPPDDGTVLLLISYGSANRECSDTAEFYASKLKQEGWRTEIAYCHHGRTVIDVISDLKLNGTKQIRVIPLFIAFDGPSAERAKHELETSGLDIVYSKPVSDLGSFYKILDSKVPEGW